MKNGDSIILPCSEESEAALLSSVLISRKAWLDCQSVIKSEHFHMDLHRKVYDRIRTLREAIPGELEWPVVLEDCQPLAVIYGGDRELLKTALNNIWGKVPSGENWKFYAGIILEKYDLRRWVDVGLKIFQQVKRVDPDMDECLSYRKEFYRSMVKNTIGTTAKEAIFQLQDDIDAITDSNRRPKILTFHLKGLSEVVLGIKAGQLLLLGGWRSSGKTAFAASVVDKCCIPSECPVLVFSFETTAVDMIARVAAIRSKVPINNITYGKLTKEENAKFAQAQIEISKADIQIVDTSMDIYEIDARIETWMNGKDFGLVVVDYAQLVQETGKKGKSLENEVSLVGRTLKMAAMREPRCAVMLLTQLNQDGASKYARALEDHSDIFLKLQLDADDERSRVIEIAKQKIGAVGSVKAGFWPECGVFY